MALLPLPIHRFALAFFGTMLRHPIAALMTLRSSLRVRFRGLRAAVWRVAYTVEALLLWRQATRRAIEHLHVHHLNGSADVAWLASVFNDRTNRPRLSWSVTVHRPALKSLRSERVLALVGSADFVVCISDFAKQRLLEAVRLLKIEGTAGPEETTLRRQASDQRLPVEFMGVLSQEDLPDEYRRADVLCLPSLREGVPTVLMEAMACGTPVVASSAGGVPELVEHQKSGILVCPGNHEELSRQRYEASPATRLYDYGWAAAASLPPLSTWGETVIC